MIDLASTQQTIAHVAIGCAIGSFLVYLAFSYKAITSEAHKKIEESLRQAVGSVKQATPASWKDAAEVLKALASLVEGLVKAGPALWSMIGSALFLLIAAFALGAGWGGGESRGRPDGNAAAGNEAAQNDTARNESADDENLNVQNSSGPR